MGQILFFFGSIAIIVLFLVKEYETVSCQVDCKNVKCPANCNCTERNVSCHGRNLTYIPCIPSGITHLNLSNSNISILSINETKNLSCSFETLTNMSLRDCKITLFVGDVFINLTQLEVLDLSFNKIVSKQNESLQSIQRALGSLNRAPLRILKLDRLLIQNGVQEIFKYFEGRHLTHLSMRENQMQEFEDRVLKNFTKLVHLDLHGNWINKINLSSGVETLELFNLSHNQINIFPPIFCDYKTGETHYSNLKNLDLSWNQIIVPYSQNWNCLKTLETLNLSRNDMEDIGKNDSFSNLTSLKTLILSEMRFSLMRMQKEALKSDSLQHLDLSGNGLNFGNHKEVDDTVFHYLPNLTSLDVSDNDLGSDGAKKLTNLSRLETLIMRRVYLRLLPDDFLGHFPNLRYLDLYRNKIEQFSASAFQNVRKIEVLNISDNLISTFPVPPFPPATLKSLKKFDFAYNYFLCDCEVVKLRKWINYVLSDPNKEKLISRYPDQYWCYKPQSLYQVLLNVAEPTHCKNTKYQLVLSVVCSASICLVFTVFLIVAYLINKITLSSGIQTLELFNLSHNQINIFPPVFCDTKTGQTRYNNLTNLDLSWNQIIVPSSPYWNCLKTLKAFNLSRNDMEDITNNDSFANLTSLKTLILSEMRTTLRRIRSEAIKSDSLQHLDLSGNGLNFEVDKEVASDIFNYLPNLMSLDVSDNDFGSVGTHKLTNLSHLETLIMTHVSLSQLPDDFLQHFPNLKYLDLHRNKIEQFSANAFQNVTKLKFLNLSRNLISNFPAPPFPLATLKSLEAFDFADNYFQCDCEIVKLQKWINDVLSDPNKHNLLSRYPDNYWCNNPKSLYQVPLKDAKPDHCTNNKYQLVLSIVCSGIICLVFTVVIVVAYVYRWEIKFLLHKMRHKSRNGYHPLTYTFEYNTYVVYAEKDSAWVIHDLLKDLEEAKYKAYTRDRDSVPGVARCDEIVDNIYKSKTVIFVLSKNFLACQWCIYQLNVAQARAVKLGPHFMIPVLLEGIDTKHMKKSVQHLFRTSKPIEWARQSTKNRLFWSELKTALDAELTDEFEETGYQSFDADYASIGT